MGEYKMLKLEDVATPMSKNSLDSNTSLQCLFPILNGAEFYKQLDELKKLPVLKIFDKRVCEFLHKLSLLIMSDSEAKNYADIISFGFFIRKANIEKLKKDYKDSLHNRMGRGLSFHIAPSNVPINFAYSLVAGLLSGNASVIRVSSKFFKQTEILCRLLENLRSQYEMTQYIKIIQYSHSKEITDKLSSLADVRVIWGGDTTINNIRQSPIAPRCVELCFADRYSISVIDSKALLKLNESELQTLAGHFYNDTYLYDQNACSSPRLIFWLNKDYANEARNRFWHYVWLNIKDRYELESIVAIDKLITQCDVALNIDNVKIEPTHDNLISRIYVPLLDEKVENYTCACGSFIESSGDCIKEVLRIVSKRFQTLTYFGVDSQMILEEIATLGILGIDRIVPIGKSSDFSLIWDGYDIIDTMSRVIDKW